MTNDKISPEYGTPPTAAAPLAHDAPEAEVNAIFGRLRALIEACGPGTNKNDRLTVLINACIDEGINTGARIVGAAKKLGFNDEHAGAVLRSGIGDRWAREDDGTYRNLV